MKVFFYGLFMDERLLATKGIKPTSISVGFVNGYGLYIGERATLLKVTNRLGLPDSYIDQIRQARA